MGMQEGQEAWFLRLREKTKQILTPGTAGHQFGWKGRVISTMPRWQIGGLYLNLNNDYDLTDRNIASPSLVKQSQVLMSVA